MMRGVAIVQNLMNRHGLRNAGLLHNRINAIPDPEPEVDPKVRTSR